LANPRQAIGAIASAAWRVVVRLHNVDSSVRRVSTHEELNVPVIKANTGIVTQINVFTVPEGGQQALIEFLAQAAEFASATPGWISASIHRSRDGTRVVNYAQSDSLEAAERIITR